MSDEKFLEWARGEFTESIALVGNCNHHFTFWIDTTFCKNCHFSTYEIDKLSNYKKSWDACKEAYGVEEVGDE